MAVPAARPTATPVINRPMSNPGRAFHAASTPAAAIIVTAPSPPPRDDGYPQQRPDRPGREDRVDHGDHERREVIPDPVEAVERARQRGERHDDEKANATTQKPEGRRRACAAGSAEPLSLAIGARSMSDLTCSRLTRTSPNLHPASGGQPGNARRPHR
jgi:hypothetical protein